MQKSRKLKGRRLAVLATDGFEKVELAIPVAALKAAGAEVEITSLMHGRIRGVNLHEPAGKVRVDKTLDEVDVQDYDGLLIPGGFINPDMLRQSEATRNFVRQFDETQKPIATLCHGPWVLASAGRMRGRTLTSWPGIRDDLVNAGATWLDREIVHDGNWITSRGPQDLAAFVPAIIDFFAEPQRVPASQRAASDPQRVEPPSVVLRTMEKLPRPSVRTLLALGLLGAGLTLSGRLAWRVRV